MATLHLGSEGSANDGTNGKVGVGTTSPNSILEAKATDVGISVMNNAGTQNYYFGIKDSDSNKLYIGRGRDPSQGISPALAIDTSDKVGVGTTSPGTTLHISGGEEPLRLQSSAASGPYMRFNEGATQRWAVGHDLNQVTDAFVIRDETNSKNALIISGSDAKVGIGGVSPSRQLTVNGDGLYLYKAFAISATSDTTIASGNSMLLLIRDTTDGGTALVLYEANSTPVIIGEAPYNNNVYIVNPPGVNQIQVKNVAEPAGVSLRAGTNRAESTVHVAVLISQT